MSETRHQRELRQIINRLRADDGYPVLFPPEPDEEEVKA